MYNLWGFHVALLKYLNNLFKVHACISISDLEDVVLKHKTRKGNHGDSKSHGIP